MESESSAYDPIPHKPHQVTVIGIMTLVGGIAALLLSFGFAASCVLLVWPGTYYSFILGIVACVRSARLLGDNAYLAPPPKGIAIMQIINIINGDLLNCGLGIATLVFLSDVEVKEYYRG